MNRTDEGRRWHRSEHPDRLRGSPVGAWCEWPFLTAFSDGDPITRGGEVAFQQSIPGARDQAHTTIEGAGHFVQEQAGAELARIIVEFIADNPVR